MASLVERIAQELNDDLLRLRTRRLLRDIREKYGCSTHTAADAVSRARVRAGVRRRFGRAR